MTDHRDVDATRANTAPPRVDDSDAETAAAPVLPTEPVTVADSLAWSQEETTPDDAVSSYDPETSLGPSSAAAAPDLKARLWQRLPQIAFGVCAVAALAAVGGAAIALTSSSHTGNPGPATHSPANTPQSPQAPATALPPPPEATTAAPVPPPTHSRVTVTRTQPPSPTVQPSTSPPPPPETTPVQTPVQTPPPETATPTPTTPAAPPMTTTYVRVPFVPVPIPIQVPSNPNQPPQNPYYPPQYGPPY